MSYVWSSDLSVGHSLIDDHHKQLYQLLNRLYQSTQAGDANAVLGDILSELVSCTLAHFRREEDLMQRVQYAGYVEHKGAHDILVREIRALQQRFYGGSITLSPEVFNFLRDWLQNHIRTYDIKLGGALPH